MQRYRNERIRPRKSLGQNFLVDEKIIEKMIVGSGVGPGDTVVEIGPGRGALTRRLTGIAGRVIAVELDERLISALRDACAPADNLQVVSGDILKTDLKQITGDSGGVKIIGSLPYYITTPIIIHVLESDARWESMTFMMQKEVAERVLAEPGTAGCGSITCLVHYHCRVEKICDVPRGAFRPVPGVDSTAVRFERLKGESRAENEDILFECVRRGFGMRRKTLANSLTGTAGLEKAEIRKILAGSGIDENRRAETLTLDEFRTIAERIADEIED